MLLFTLLLTPKSSWFSGMARSFNPTALYSNKRSSSWRNIHEYTNSMTSKLYRDAEKPTVLFWALAHRSAADSTERMWATEKAWVADVSLCWSRTVYGRLQMRRSPGARRCVSPHKPAFPVQQKENETGGGHDDYMCIKVAQGRDGRCLNKKSETPEGNSAYVSLLRCQGLRVQAANLLFKWKLGVVDSNEDAGWHSSLAWKACNCLLHKDKYEWGMMLSLIYFVFVKMFCIKACEWPECSTFDVVCNLLQILTLICITFSLRWNILFLFHRKIITQLWKQIGCIYFVLQWRP